MPCGLTMLHNGHLEKNYRSRHEKPLIKLLVRLDPLTLKQYRLLLCALVASLRLKVSPSC